MRAGVAVAIGFVAIMAGCSSASRGPAPPTPTPTAEPAPTPAAAPVPTAEPATEGDMNELERAVRAGNPSAVTRAAAIGPAAKKVLVPLVSDPDPVVRMIALGCLDASEADGVELVFVAALADDSPTTSVEAVRALNKRLSDDLIEPLLAIYDRLEEARRRDVALMLGALSARVSRLESMLAGETASEVKEALVAALAKRGSPSHRRQFLATLASARGDIDQGAPLKRYFALVEYLEADWVLPGLRRLLDDETPLVYIGTHGALDGPESLRACDVALNLLARSPRVSLSFKVRGNVNYTPAQRAEAKKATDSK